MLVRRRLHLESLELRRLLATTTIDAEPNNTPLQAQVFTFGDDDGVAILQGTSTSKDDKDFFQFTAPANGQLQVSLPGRGATLEIDNLLEVEPHDGVTSGVANVVAGQTYFVRLRSAEDTAADYEATLTFTAGDFPPTTGGDSGDDHGDDGPDHDVGDDHGDDGPGHDADDDHGDDGATGGTTLTTEDPAAVVVAEAEPNNSRGASQQFELAGSTRLEGAANQSDRDFFAFTVPADGIYTVGVRAPDGSAVGGKVQVEIEDQAGHDVLELEPHDGIHSGAAQFVAGRTYFLRVKAEAAVETTYAIDLQPVDPSAAPAAAAMAPATSARQAALNKLDTDGDDAVSAVDVLGIINYLNAHRGESAHDLFELVYDIDDDGYVAPIDALRVINYLNSGGDSLPAAEPAAVSPAALIAPTDTVPPTAVPPVDPTLVGVTTSDDPATHDTNDDHGVDTLPETDDSGHDSPSDLYGGTDAYDDDDDDHEGDSSDDDSDDDYADSVDDLMAEIEREFEHAKR